LASFLHSASDARIGGEAPAGAWRPVGDHQPMNITASASTSAPRGSSLTPTAARAGKGLAEILGHRFVDLGEVGQVGQEDVELDHIGQRTAGGFGHRLEILEDANDLRVDPVYHLHGSRIEADLPGHINGIADATACE
jgi:hypothetical protein